MNGAKEHNIGLNRKMLAEMAVNDPEAFSQLVGRVKEPATA
jgi:large subunit ribosomal protein L20|tara:strand:+ start:303 stop:425 length:123 start_codon:yes stop_codon:yes gene_type:complete